MAARQGDIVARCGKGHAWTKLEIESKTFGQRRIGTVKRSIDGDDYYEHTYACPLDDDSLTVYGKVVDGESELLSEDEALRVLGGAVSRRTIENTRRASESVSSTLAEATSITQSATDSFKRVREFLSDTSIKLSSANERCARITGKFARASGAFDAAGARNFLVELQALWSEYMPSPDGGHIARPITRDDMRTILDALASAVEDARKGL